MRAVLGGRGYVVGALVLFSLGAADPVPGLRSANAPPVLLSFSVQAVGGAYVAQGTVSDESPDLCIIYFGGALYGHAALCGADGTFAYTIEGSVEGSASAYAMDELDQTSDTLWTTISP